MFKKLSILVVVLAILLITVGCSIEAFLKINGDGSGEGNVYLYDVSESPDNIKEKITRDYGFKVDDIQIEGNTTKCKISWQRFGEIKTFVGRTVNNDNTTTLNIGSVSSMTYGLQGTATVEVPGKIKYTTGYVDKNNDHRVAFTRDMGTMIITYENVSYPKIFIWVLVFLGILWIVFRYKNTIIEKLNKPMG